MQIARRPQHALGAKTHRARSPGGRCEVSRAGSWTRTLVRRHKCQKAEARTHFNVNVKGACLRRPRAVRIACKAPPGPIKPSMILGWASHQR